MAYIDIACAHAGCKIRVTYYMPLGAGRDYLESVVERDGWTVEGELGEELRHWCPEHKERPVKFGAGIKGAEKVKAVDELLGRLRPLLLQCDYWLTESVGRETVLVVTAKALPTPSEHPLFKCCYVHCENEARDHPVELGRQGWKHNLAIKGLCCPVHASWTAECFSVDAEARLAECVDKAAGRIQNAADRNGDVLDLNGLDVTHLGRDVVDLQPDYSETLIEEPKANAVRCPRRNLEGRQCTEMLDASGSHFQPHKFDTWRDRPAML